MCAMRRVAVTGMGMVSPLGNTLDEAYSNAYSGRSAIHRLELPLSHRLLAPLAATVRFAGADHFAPPSNECWIG